jgi:hypothetical protein
MTKPFDLDAFEARLERQGTITPDDAETLIEHLRNEQAKRAELEEEARAYAERDLIIQTALATAGHVEALGGPQGRVAHVTVSALARVLLMLMIKPDGSLYNYIEWEVDQLPETGPLSIALQRGNGKTPGVLINEARADSAALREVLTTALYCPDCGGRGVHWTDSDGEAEAEVCDCRVAAEAALAASHPGAPFLALLAAARAYLAAWYGGDAFPTGPLAIGERWEALRQAIEAFDGGLR